MWKFSMFLLVCGAISIRMEKTLRSRFAAIHPFQIAHEVSNWLGISRREPGLGIAKCPGLRCSSARGADDSCKRHRHPQNSAILVALLAVALKTACGSATPRERERQIAPKNSRHFSLKAESTSRRLLQLVHQPRKSPHDVQSRRSPLVLIHHELLDVLFRLPLLDLLPN